MKQINELYQRLYLSQEETGAAAFPIGTGRTPHPHVTSSRGCILKLKLKAVNGSQNHQNPVISSIGLRNNKIMHSHTLVISLGRSCPAI